MPTAPPDRLPDGHEFTKFYKKRARKNMDLFVVVSDQHNRRGTGKSVVSLRLAHTLDRSGTDVQPAQTTLSVPELRDAYTDLPRGASLVLDEAEAGVSKYEAGTRTNKAIRKLVSMGRIEEKTVIMNLPNSGAMDRDLKALADVWVLVQSRGQAQVNILGYNPWEDHPIVRAQESLEWADIPTDHYLRDVYNALTREKRARLRGDGDEVDLVRGDEVERRVERAREEARREARNEILRELYERQDDLRHRDLADAVDVSRSTVSNILNGSTS
jgi:hypothetical protein